MLLFTALLSSSFAAELTVCASGCDSTTIQGAIDASRDGDTVSIAAGAYREHLTVAHRVSLRPSSPMAGTVLIEGNGTDTLLEVTEAGVAQIRWIDFTGGGGVAAIVNDGELRLSGSNVFNNVGTYGAVFNAGTMLIREDGAIFENTSTGRHAGGITNVGALKIYECSFLGNVGYAGGAIANRSGELNVNGSFFSGNASDTGGAIYNHSGELLITGSFFLGNTAETLGGAWSSHGDGAVSVMDVGYIGNATDSGLYKRCYDVLGGCVR